MTRLRPALVCRAAALWMLAAAGAGAQTPPALRLTIEDAQARALAASYRLAEARAREAAARSVVLSREAAERPTVTASGGYTRTNHVVEFTVPGPTGVPRVLYPDVPTNYFTRVNLQWPIYSGGRTDALERAARAEADAASADLATAQADLRLEVARAYWAVVTSRASVVVIEQGVARARAHLADVRERFDAGLVPPNEIASAEAQESRARMLLIEAQNQRDVSLADLARLTGLDPSEPIEPAADLAGPDAVLRVDTLVESARTARDERRAMLFRIDAADEQRQAAAAGRRPTVGVAGGVDYARPNPRIFPRTDQWQESWELGINVNWTIWDGGRIAAEVATLTSLASAARHRLAEFDSVLSVDVRQRALEIESGRAAVAAAEDAIRAATEARRVVTERYRVGVATQTEVLDAELALLQSELDRTRALAGVRLAEARLARTVGR
jgi:outer membrane protein TolC